MGMRILVLAVLTGFIFSITGCAMCRKQDLEMQGLKNQVITLESQVQSKDEEINSLKEQLARLPQENIAESRQVVSKKRVIGEVKSRPNIKQIQIALENAGYNPGRIDGKMGKGTRDAIKAFQRANGLVADGRVGKRTWAALRNYLYKKVK